MAYKVIMPGANGAGKFGEILSGPFIGEPNSIHTQTFMHFGPFQEKSDAIACLTYIKTKFFRAMLGVLKVTQNTPKSVWSKDSSFEFHFDIRHQLERIHRRHRPAALQEVRPFPRRN